MLLELQQQVADRVWSGRASTLSVKSCVPCRHRHTMKANMMFAHVSLPYSHTSAHGDYHVEHAQVLGYAQSNPAVVPIALGKITLLSTLPNISNQKWLHLSVALRYFPLL